MASRTGPTRALDVVVTLRRAGLAWWRDFVPITGLGAALVTLPDLVAHALSAAAPGPEAAMLIGTAEAVCLILFFAVVSRGVVHALAGRPLGTRDFVVIGLAGARPGVVTGLLLMTALFTVGIVFTVGAWLGPAAVLVNAGAVCLALAGTAILLPAVPAAAAEQLGAVASLERAAGLTRGNRARLLGLVLLVLLAFVPVNGVIAITVFGQSATTAAISASYARMTLLDPGLWIVELSTLLIVGLLACIPPTVYAALAVGVKRQ